MAAVSMCTPTNDMYSPGTQVEGATTGVDWRWSATFGGPTVVNSPNPGHNIYINVLAADTIAQIKAKVVAAANAYCVANWNDTVANASCLVVDMTWGA